MKVKVSKTFRAAGVLKDGVPRLTEVAVEFEDVPQISYFNTDLETEAKYEKEF